MKIFRLNRLSDVSGTSGENPCIAYGIILHTGQAILTWRTEYSSVCVYNSIDVLESIHSHNGKTKVEYFLPSRPMQKSLQEFLSGKEETKKV